jgi:pyruvate oxidase
MAPESLPQITDEAVRRAYKHKGVAVITIPVNFGLIDIDEGYFSSAINRRESILMPDSKDISEAIILISKAKRPVLYVGQGIKGASQEAIKLAKHYSMPIISSVMAKGIIPDDTANYMGTAARVASKPANEALSESDLILFTGSDFTFAKFFFPKNAKFIQTNRHRLFQAQQTPQNGCCNFSKRKRNYETS